MIYLFILLKSSEQQTSSWCWKRNGEKKNKIKSSEKLKFESTRGRKRAIVISHSGIRRLSGKWIWTGEICSNYLTRLFIITPAFCVYFSRSLDNNNLPSFVCCQPAFSARRFDWRRRPDIGWSSGTQRAPHQWVVLREGCVALKFVITVPHHRVTDHSYWSVTDQLLISYWSQLLITVTDHS